MKKTIFALLMILALVLAACAQPAAEPAPAEPAAEEAAPAEPAAEEPAPAEPAAEEAAPAASGVTELKILWAQWDPANYLQELVKDYEAETGIKVTVVQEPWGSFGDRFNTAMAGGSDEWDMVVGDSQWLGQSVTSGFYVDMTEFLTSTGLKDSVTPATLTYYGEYPAGSGKYYGFPTEGDADGWAYRKDLFENPDEMAAFEAEYGYPLAVPETYAQLMDIAKFFTRPDDNLYGLAIYTQIDYDALTMGVENVLFSWGADLYNPETYEVEGVINSPEAVESLQFYRDLYECCQVPGLSNAFFTEVNDAIIGGQAVMGMNYFAFFPGLVNPDMNPYAANMGFFPNPKGPTGAQHAALGGQGTSIISFISPERQQASFDFIKWFGQESVQTKWAELGGYTCNSNVLASDAFLNATPFNPAFATTMTFVKDFFNIPPFGQLLQVSQREWSKFIIEGQGDAQTTMDTVAAEWTTILTDTGFIK